MFGRIFRGLGAVAEALEALATTVRTANAQMRAAIGGHDPADVIELQAAEPHKALPVAQPLNGMNGRKRTTTKV